MVPSLQTVANISEKYGCSIDSIVLHKNSDTVCRYRINETVVYDEDGNAHTSYGVDAVNIKGNIIESIPDVFFEYAEAERLIKLFNMCNLSLAHLKDTIEDWLDK